MIANTLAENIANLNLYDFASWKTQTRTHKNIRVNFCDWHLWDSSALRNIVKTYSAGYVPIHVRPFIQYASHKHVELRKHNEGDEWELVNSCKDMHTFLESLRRFSNFRTTAQFFSSCEREQYSQ